MKPMHFLIVVLFTMLVLAGCSMPVPAPETETPPDPVKLAITVSRTQSGIQLDWQDVADSDLYRIYRRSDPSSAWTLMTACPTSNYLDTDIAKPWYEYKVDALSNSAIKQEGEPKSINLVGEYFINDAGRSTKYLISMYNVDGSRKWRMNCYFTFQNISDGDQVLLCTPDYDKTSEPLTLKIDEDLTYINGCFGNTYVKSLASNILFKRTWLVYGTGSTGTFRNTQYQITHLDTTTLTVRDIDGNQIEKTFTDCVKVSYDSRNTTLTWLGAKGTGYYLYQRGEGLVYHEHTLSVSDSVGNENESFQTYQLEPSVLLAQTKTISGKTVSKKDTGVPAQAVKAYCGFKLSGISGTDGLYQIPNIFLPDNAYVTVFFDYDTNGDNYPDNSCFGWTTRKNIASGTTQQITMADYPIYYYDTAPVIFSSNPSTGATAVSVSLSSIQIVFNQIMRTSYSLGYSSGLYPPTNSNLLSWSHDYVNERSTLTIAFSQTLAAATLYSVVTNPETYTNTRNACGMPAVQEEITFTTE